MAATREQTVQQALREDMQSLVLLRLCWVLVISVIGLALSGLSDLRFGQAVPYDLIAVKMAGACATLLAVALLIAVKRSSWNASMAAAVVAWGLSCAVVSVNGAYTGDPIMPTLLLPVMIVGSGIAIPWGMAPQLAVVVVAS
jgi:hypothetical protein